MKSVSHKHQHYSVWIAIIVAVVLIAVYGGGAVYAVKQKEAIKTQAQELAYESSRERSMHSVADLLDDVAAERHTLGTFFVSSSNAVEFIELIENLSSVVGSDIAISGVREDSGKDGTGTLAMDVASVGSWQSMMHLLALLGTLPRSSSVSSVTFVRSDSSAGSQWTLRARVEAVLVH